MLNHTFIFFNIFLMYTVFLTKKGKEAENQASLPFNILILKNDMSHLG